MNHELGSCLLFGAIDHSTTQRKLRPFWGVWQATRKDDAPNVKVLSTSCRKTCHCRVLVRENSHKGQNGKATVCFCFCFFVLLLLCDAVFLVSFPVEHRHLTTCTKACQTISGLVRETRGRLIIPRHAIG